MFNACSDLGSRQAGHEDKNDPGYSDRSKNRDGGASRGSRFCIYNCSITYPRFCNNAITLFGPEK